MEHFHKQLMVTTADRQLPLHIETVGWNSIQYEIRRTAGYHCYHWLHTTGGEGRFWIEGNEVRLAEKQGILLKPRTPHRYLAVDNDWSTWYVTFSGIHAGAIVSSLEIPLNTVISWDASAISLNIIHETYWHRQHGGYDFSCLNTSAELYRFLVDLKQAGHVDHYRSKTRVHSRLQPLLRIMESSYSDPSFGLQQMADIVGISPQLLNTLFRNFSGMSPYQYLIQLRIQKSKELLLLHNGRTVKQIASQVGFMDASHFISTFRRLEGTTPERFRSSI